MPRRYRCQGIDDRNLARLGLPFEAIYSTFGRILARGIESKLLVDRMAGWHDRLMANIERGDLRTFNDAKWAPESWPRHSRGIGTIEGPRGALAHWVVIDDGVITNYQAVVPTTWNAGPKDERGQPGPYEAALMDGHRLEYLISLWKCSAPYIALIHAWHVLPMSSTAIAVRSLK